MNVNDNFLNQLGSFVQEVLIPIGIALSAIWIFFKKQLISYLKKALSEDMITREEAERMVSDAIDDCEDRQYETIDKQIEEALEKYSIDSKNRFTEVYDERYLTRKEFKMYLDGQEKRDERIESQLQNVADLINVLIEKIR